MRSGQFSDLDCTFGTNQTPVDIVAVTSHDKTAKFSENYETLRKMARARLRRHQPFTMLDTTALVHESYLKLCTGGVIYPEDQTAFLNYVGQVMRSVIVDTARSRLTKRRGTHPMKMVLDEEISTVDELDRQAANEIVQIHEALEVLHGSDQRVAEVLALSYFAGMSEMEIALCLNISDRTVRRDSAKAHMLMRAILLG